MKRKRHGIRVVNGVRFECTRPGLWASTDQKWVIYRMLPNTANEQWEAYPFADDLDGELCYAEMRLGGCLEALVAAEYKK